MPDENLKPENKSENLEPILEHILVHADRSAKETHGLLENQIEQEARNGTTLEHSLEAQGRILKATEKTAESISELAKNLNPQETAEGTAIVIKGPKGDQGEKGEKGDTGEKGEKGDQGERGEAGMPGESGAPGKPGETGKMGATGEKGDQGEPGMRGEKGERGENGSPDSAEQIKAKLESLPKGQRFDYDKLDNLPNLTALQAMVERSMRQSSRDYDLAELKDVSIGNQTDGQALVWSRSAGKWVPGTVGGGGGGTVTGATNGLNMDGTEVSIGGALTNTTIVLMGIGSNYTMNWERTFRNVTQTYTHSASGEVFNTGDRAGQLLVSNRGYMKTATDSNNYTGTFFQDSTTDMALIGTVGLTEHLGSGQLDVAVGTVGAIGGGANGPITHAAGFAADVGNFINSNINYHKSYGLYVTIGNTTAVGTFDESYGVFINRLQGTSKVGFFCDIEDSVNVMRDVQIKAQTRVYWYDADDSNYVAFHAPATVAADTTYTLPDAFPSVTGYALVSTDAGVMSWAALTGITLGNFGSSPNAAGLTLSAGVLNLEPASAMWGGAVSITTQDFYGKKTWSWTDTGNTAFTGQTFTTTVSNSISTGGTTIGSQDTLTVSNSTANTGSLFAHVALAHSNNGATLNVIAGSAPQAVVGGSGSANFAVGTSGTAVSSGSSSVTAAAGVLADVEAFGTSTISNAYGFMVTMTKASGATVSVSTGLYIQSLTGGTKYGVYADIAGSKNVFHEIQIRAAQQLQFFDSGANHVAFRAPTTVASNVNWILPGTDSTGTQALVSNGSGTMSWASLVGITLDVIGTTPNANGATLTGSVLNLEPANENFGGIVSTVAQTFKGAKKIENTYADTGGFSLNAEIRINSTADDANDYVALNGNIIVDDNFNHTPGITAAAFFNFEHAGLGTVDTAIGGIGNIRNTTAGAITLAAGLNGIINNDSTGTIGLAIGSYVGVTNNGGGAISRAVGLLVDTLDGDEKIGVSADVYHSTNILRQIDQTSESADNKVIQNKVLFVDTGDDTPTELTDDGNAGSGATNRIAVPVDTAMSVVLNICAKESGSGNAKQFLRQFVIVNNGGTTALVGAVTTLGTDIGSVALATASVAITANDTDDCIQVDVTGVAATDLRWTANVVSCETTYS